MLFAELKLSVTSRYSLANCKMDLW